MRILSVAYALAPVRENTSGGAEQVLRMLDAALVRAGHQSAVVAAKGSVVAGRLVEGPVTPERLDENAIAAARRAHADAVRGALACAPDLVHFHGQDCAACLPLLQAAGCPAVVTLHVPQAWYADPAPWALPGVHCVFVSEAQRRSWSGLPASWCVIPNGVDLGAIAPRPRKRGFALALGRVSPEKGTALALQAARQAGVPMLLAGEVYGYAAHRQYFRSQVAPLLDGRERRFLGPVGLARKRRLLAAARCVVLASQAPETSSLVAMEALAAGTPVVAFPAGALAEIVEHGRTGFLVRSLDEMAAAILDAGTLDPAECRRAACERFDSRRTVSAYLALYEELSGANRVQRHRVA